MQMPKTTVTTVQEITISPRLQKRLLTELHAYATLSSELKALDEAKKGHSSQVLLLADEVGAEKFDVEGYKVAVVKGARDKRLDKDRLIKRLIADGKYSMKAAIMLLEDCTSEKPKKDHVRITLPHEQEGE